MNGYWFVVAVILAVATVAPATEQVVLEADADSYVRYAFNNDDGEIWGEMYYDDNYGGDVRMYVKKSLYKQSDIKISYVYFDFSELEGYGYDAENLARAQLVFYAQDDADWEKYVYVLEEPWDEMTVTYLTRPDFGDKVATFDHIDAGYNYIELDVGPIAPWVDAPETAFGFGIDSINDYHHIHEVILYSREGGIPAKLYLTFSMPDVQEASWGEIKASF
jgi:hypothetical protein